MRDTPVPPVRGGREGDGVHLARRVVLPGDGVAVREQRRLPTHLRRVRGGRPDDDVRARADALLRDWGRFVRQQPSHRRLADPFLRDGRGRRGVDLRGVRRERRGAVRHARGRRRAPVRARAEQEVQRRVLREHLQHLSPRPHVPGGKRARVLASLGGGVGGRGGVGGDGRRSPARPERACGAPRAATGEGVAGATSVCPEDGGRTVPRGGAGKPGG